MFWSSIFSVTTKFCRFAGGGGAASCFCSIGCPSLLIVDLNCIVPQAVEGLLAISDYQRRRVFQRLRPNMRQISRNRTRRRRDGAMSPSSTLSPATTGRSVRLSPRVPLRFTCTLPSTFQPLAPDSAGSLAACVRCQVLAQPVWLAKRLAGCRHRSRRSFVMFEVKGARRPRAQLCGGMSWRRRG